MTGIKFSWKDSLVSKSEINKLERKLQPEIEDMQEAELKEYNDLRASINLPEDLGNLKIVKSVVRDCLKLKPDYLVVVGIGGSNLGTIAVQEAVLGELYNQLDSQLKVLYIDTVDSDSLSDVLRIIEPALKKGKKVVVNGISKSGRTTETIANFEIVVGLLRKYIKDYEKYVVVTSDKFSPFWDLALDKSFNVLEIPKRVGGRYSVFSSVGLFPLGMLGVNLERLLRGAKDMKKICLHTDIRKNPAALSAAIQYKNHKKGKKISNMFLFSNDLESIGKWERQLMGESIGKKGRGITPTFAIGSTDLHSLVQLYLGGPNDKIHSFISVKKNNTNLAVPNLSEYSELVDDIQKKPLSEIMDAILSGVRASFRKGKRPFIDVELPNKKAFTIGALLQYKMMEMMYLGYLLNVNPFNQPDVEGYKKITRGLLG
jgi:glucose-6-phosphate isomerase